LVFAIIAGNLCAVVGNRIYAGRVHRGLRSFPFLYSRERLRELFSYGIAAFVTRAAIQIIGQSDLVIVGIFLSISDVREYSIGAMLVYYSSTFLSIIGTTLFPAIQRTVSGGTLEEVRQLFYRQLQITLCVGLLVYIGFIFYSKYFISLWMLQDSFDHHAVLGAAGVMTVLAFSKTPTLFNLPCKNVLAALGHVGFTARLAMAEAVVNLLLSRVFVKVFNLGIFGVALGTLTSCVLVTSFVLPLYLCRKLNIAGIQYLRTLVFPGIVSAGRFSIICFLLLKIWSPDTWIEFASHIFILVLFWLFLGTFLLLPEDIRKQAIVKFMKSDS